MHACVCINVYRCVFSTLCVGVLEWRVWSMGDRVSRLHGQTLGELGAHTQCVVHLNPTQGSSVCPLPLPHQSGEQGVSEGGENVVCVAVGDPVSVLCVDQITGCIVVAVQSTLKYVYTRKYSKAKEAFKAVS